MNICDTQTKWYRGQFRVFLRYLSLTIILFGISTTEAGPAGDVAPSGAPDGVLDVADLLILEKFVTGSLIPTAQELLIADVAPLGAPDGQLNAGDVVVLQRAIMGLVTLPPVVTGPDAPVIDAVTSPTNANPYVLTGTALPNLEVRIYINGTQQLTTMSSAGGTFSADVALFDGNNDIHATVWDSAAESLPGNTVTIDYQNNINRDLTNTTITQNTVWTPGSAPTSYVVTGTLTVAAGAELILQPGVELRFTYGASLVVNGGISVRGEATNRVKFTSNLSPSLGQWAGITVSSGASPVDFEYAFIEMTTFALVVNGADFRLANSEIKSFWNVGLQVNDVSNGVVENNIFHIGMGYPPYYYPAGVAVYRSYIHMTGNLIEKTYAGIWIGEAANPLIDAGNIITDNQKGISIYGDGTNASNNPAPIITGNEIKFNQDFDLSVANFESNLPIELDVSGNWWGSADPNDILTGIRDFRENGSYDTPLVKVAPYLDAPNGVLIGSNSVSRLITQDETIGPGPPTLIMGALVVMPGITLTLQAGAELRFIDRSRLFVLGTIKSEGLPSTPVLLTSDNLQPMRGSWWGVVVGDPNNGGSSPSASIIQNTIIEYVNTAISVFGDDVAIADNTIREMSGIGVYLSQSANGVVSGNLIENGDFNGIGVYSSSPSLINNSIQNVDTGIAAGNGTSIIEGNNIQGTTIAVAIGAGIVRNGNIITNNDYGIYVNASSQASANNLPIVNGNSIFSNNIYNYYASGYASPSSVILDATGNWWGSDQPATIVAGIFDNARASTTSPIVDFSPFLTAPNGVLQESDLFYGYLNQDFTVPAGQSLQMAGGVIVPPGFTLTLEEGTTIAFPSGAGITVLGNLYINGTSNNKVRLTAIDNSQGSNSWDGLLLDWYGARHIHHAIIEYARNGVKVISGGLNIYDSLLENNNYGVDFSTTGTSLLATNNVFSNNYTGVSVHMPDPYSLLSFPTATINGNEFINNTWGLELRNTGAGTIVSDNRIENNVSYGIRIIGACSADISGNLITGSSTGIYAQSGGVGGYSWDPAPVVNGNNILGNTTYNFEVSFFNNSSAAVNATQNWWGTDVLADIETTIRHKVDVPSFPTVDFSPISQNVILLPPVLTSTLSLTKNPVYTLTGRAVADTQVDVYLEGGFHISTMADPQGDFTVDVNLAEGLNTISAKSVDASSESTFSVNFFVTLDTVPPIITVTAPQDGGFTNQDQQLVTGSLNEAASLQINSSTVAVATNNSFTHGPLTLVQGANVISLDATDLAGNITAQLLTVTLDTAPPATPDPANLTTVELAGPVLEVSGGALSAEPDAFIRLVNARTGETATGTINPDGSFTITLAGQAGDYFYVLVQDQAGNASAWLDYTLSGTPPAPAVAISQPSNGANIASDWISVSGTVQAGAQSSVVVNGLPAVVNGSQFQVSELPLVPGAQTIDVVVTTRDGTSVTDSITVTSSASSLVTLSVDEPVGSAPHAVSFTLSIDPSITVQTIELDIDDDGTVDVTETDPDAALTYTYTNTGLYTTRVTVTDSLSATYTSEVTVLVRDLVGMSAVLRGVYDGMMNALRAGDVPGAMLFASEHVKNKYEGVLTSLGAGLPAVVDQLGQVLGGAFGGEVAEILVVRDEAGQQMLYTVYLVKGTDGVWRVGEM